MQARWRDDTNILQLAALVVFAATFVGCAGNDQCFPDGHCVAMPGNFGFYARWAGVILLGCLALFGVILAVGLFSESAGAGCGVFALTAAVIGLAAWMYPGTTSPRARAEAEAKQYGEQVEKMARDAENERKRSAEQAEEQRRISETPTYQLNTARGAQAALKKRRDEMQDTRTKWQHEFEKLRRHLEGSLPRTGVKSHQELVNRADVPPQAINLLNRAAHLRVLVAELDGLLASADRTLIELDQQIWKLEKMIELNNVTTPEESAAIRRALASATELVSERTSPAKREDIAAEEAKLFRELMGGAR